MATVDSSLASKCMDFCHALTSHKKSFNFSLIIGSNFRFSLDTKEDLPPASKAVRKKSPSAKRRNERRRAEFLLRRSETQSTVNQVAADIIDVTLANKDGLQDGAHQVVLNSNDDAPQSPPSSILSLSTTAPPASLTSTPPSSSLPPSLQASTTPTSKTLPPSSPGWKVVSPRQRKAILAPPTTLSAPGPPAPSPKKLEYITFFD